MSTIILLCRVKALDNEMGKAWFSFYSNSVSKSSLCYPYALKDILILIQTTFHICFLSEKYMPCHHKFFLANLFLHSTPFQNQATHLLTGCKM